LRCSASWFRGSSSPRRCRPTGRFRYSCWRLHHSLSVWGGRLRRGAGRWPLFADLRPVGCDQSNSWGVSTTASGGWRSGRATRYSVGRGGSTTGWRAYLPAST